MGWIKRLLRLEDSELDRKHHRAELLLQLGQVVALAQKALNIKQYIEARTYLSNVKDIASKQQKSADNDEEKWIWIRMGRPASQGITAIDLFLARKVKDKKKFLGSLAASIERINRSIAEVAAYNHNH